MIKLTSEQVGYRALKVYVGEDVDRIVGNTCETQERIRATHTERKSFICIQVTSKAAGVEDRAERRFECSGRRAIIKGWEEDKEPGKRNKEYYIMEVHISGKCHSKIEEKGQTTKWLATFRRVQRVARANSGL